MNEAEKRVKILEVFHESVSFAFTHRLLYTETYFGRTVVDHVAEYMRQKDFFTVRSRVFVPDATNS